jgi:glycosyltransferase 2 family protein
MKRLYFFLRLLLSLGLIIFLINLVDLNELRQVLVQGSLGFIALAYLLGIVDRILMAYKWRILLQARQIYISLKDTTILYLTCTFLGLFLPATVGGDIFRAYAVTKDEEAVGDVISSIVLERVLGLVALMVFVILSILLSILVLGQGFITNVWSLLGVMVVLFGATAVILLISFKEVNLHRLLGKIEPLTRRWQHLWQGRKLTRLVGNTYRSYQKYRHNGRELALFLFYSFIENIFPILWSYCLALAFGIDVPLLYFFILVPLVLALRRLPISIDGIGVHQGAFVYFLSLINVPQAESLLLGIATHLLALAIILPGGLFYIFSGLNYQEAIQIAERGLDQMSVEVQPDTAV